MAFFNSNKKISWLFALIRKVGICINTVWLYPRDVHICQESRPTIYKQKEFCTFCVSLPFRSSTGDHHTARPHLGEAAPHGTWPTAWRSCAWPRSCLGLLLSIESNLCLAGLCEGWGILGGAAGLMALSALSQPPESVLTYVEIRSRISENWSAPRQWKREWKTSECKTCKDFRRLVGDICRSTLGNGSHKVEAAVQQARDGTHMEADAVMASVRRYAIGPQMQSYADQIVNPRVIGCQNNPEVELRPPPGEVKKGNIPGEYWQIDFSGLPKCNHYINNFWYW